MKRYQIETFEFNYLALAGTGDAATPVGENDNFASTYSHHYLDYNRLVLKNTSAMSITVDAYEPASLDLISSFTMMPNDLTYNNKSLLTLANTSRDSDVHLEMFLSLVYIFKFQTTSLPYIQDTEMTVIVQGYMDSDYDVSVLKAQVDEQIEIIKSTNSNSNNAINTAASVIDSLVDH